MTTMSPAEHAVWRGAVMGRIQTCRACPLVDDTHHGPVVFRGRTPNPLMALGEAPGGTEDRWGRPFIGPSGKHLERLFEDRGLPALRSWFVTNVCCCRSDGPPGLDDRQACEPNLRAQVALCDPTWILALGGTALQAIIPRAKITAVHGRPFFVPAGPFHDRWVMPTFHPAAALRDDHRNMELHSDLTTLAAILDGKILAETVACQVGRGGKLFT